jgi:outer membrane protein assembly factor BamA
VLALRAGAGGTVGAGDFHDSYAVGGFGSGSLLDVIGSNQSVLRGYDDDVATGRSFAHANAELRLPLLHPQRGLRLVPLFVRHVHGAAFFDAAHAWTGRLQLDEARTAVGAALGADVIVGHNLPLTVTGGVAFPLRYGASARGYFRVGLAF